MNISYLTTQEAVYISLTLSPICSLRQRQTVSGEAVPTCEESSRLKAQSRELISTYSRLAPHLGQTPTTSAHRDCTIRTRTGKEPALSGPSVQFSSIAQSYPTLRPRGLQHARLAYPSPAPGAYSNPCPSSQWRHPTISSSVAPFSSHIQFFPETGSFPMSQFFTLGGQSIGLSASASVLPMNIQD